MEYAALSGEPKEEPLLSKEPEPKTEPQDKSFLSLLQTWFQTIINFVVQPPATRLQ
jgi:hypothetical protein